MEELEVTWNRAARIWWSLLWRSVLFGVLAGFAAGFIVGIILSAIGKQESTEYFGQLAGLLVGIPVGIWVVKVVLTKQFRHYRIALLPSTEALIEKSVSEGNG